MEILSNEGRINSNADAGRLIARINATGIRNRAASSLKQGLRNIVDDCRTTGCGSGGALHAAERWLATHETQ